MTELEQATLNLAKAKQRWKDAIKAEVEAGEPLRRIARRAGVSHQQISRLFKRREQ